MRIYSQALSAEMAGFTSMIPPIFRMVPFDSCATRVYHRVLSNMSLVKSFRYHLCDSASGTFNLTFTEDLHKQVSLSFVQLLPTLQIQQHSTQLRHTIPTFTHHPHRR